MTKLSPPIKDRTTEQLLIIVSSPEDWNKTALLQAEAELKVRNIQEKEINQNKYYARKATELNILKRAKASYSILDFISHPLTTLLEIIVSWELRKDGFDRKADQQRFLRPIFIFVIIMIVVILSW
ncbi:hypothetical protein ACS5PU_19480 [Pedobacter sp. GSP4]|uniref:hypothetical protein n=1 Tax=Pedobacter sp. GSP4 TaxID=3453716 RepID=UPI003EEB3745